MLFHRLFLIVAVLASISLSACDFRSPAEKVSDMVRPVAALYLGDAERAAGSAVVISRDGFRAFLLTAAHVVSDLSEETKLFAVLPRVLGDARLPVKIEHVSKDVDLALISVSMPVDVSLRAAPLCIAPPPLGADVWSVGAGAGRLPFLTRGVIGDENFHYRYEVGEKLHRGILHSASITFGSSGGPLYSDYGCLIGINVYIHAASSSPFLFVGLLPAFHMSVAVPLDLIFTYLETYHARTVAPN